MSVDHEVRSVRVQIFGEEHVIRGQASEEYIENLAALVDSRLEEVQKNSPLLPRHRVAILVAINLANELEKLSAEHEDLLALLEEAN
ncbi:MAG TPA: cell division protein ZapA [Firmicutes bacterium]|jgi:cell division protein ZapA|nr:cell division protein ZapA [Bacillota bacterium]